METQIKIVMADDHPIVRQGLRKLIETDKNLSIVAEAGDGSEALELIEIHQPDIAVLDIDMPVADGFAVVRELQKRRSEVEVIFLTMHGERAIFEAAMDLSVKGYVLKDSAVSDIVSAIKTVAKGQAIFKSRLCRRCYSNAAAAPKRSNRKNLDCICSRRPKKEFWNSLPKTKPQKKSAKNYSSAAAPSKVTALISRANSDLSGSLALIKFAAAS